MTQGVKRLNGLWILALSLLLCLPGAAAPQATARVGSSQENFRRDPNGRQLATVMGGVELPVLAERGDWVQVELSGYIWAPSVSATDREGFDLIVSAAGGENLRATPQGRVVARLLRGFLLERVSASGNWVQVRRSGWLWKRSLTITGTVAAAGAADAGVESAETTNELGPTILTAPSPLIIHATPDGDTVAAFQPGAQAQILGRTGDWIRVRVDGWVYGPAALDSALALLDTGDLTPAQLRSDPSRYKGALVRWRVQVISLRRAEPARSDFEEGEPFLLARAAGDPGFVYLAVPDELLPVAEELRPLEFATVVGRVRTGRSQLLGSPVVDLTDVERIVNTQ